MSGSEQAASEGCAPGFPSAQSLLQTHLPSGRPTGIFVSISRGSPGPGDFWQGTAEANLTPYSRCPSAPSLLACLILTACSAGELLTLQDLYPKPKRISNLRWRNRDPSTSEHRGGTAFLGKQHLLLASADNNCANLPG